MKQPNPKKCLHCGTLFEVKRFLQTHCSPACTIAYTKEHTKGWGKRPVINSKPVKSQSDTKPHADHLNELQIVFNRYIRERDKGEYCISCNCEWDKSFQAGHYWSVGAFPALRFHEDNVHGQCYNCNIELMGNSMGYAQWLSFRIGDERHFELNITRAQPLKLSIPEIIELKEKYKLKMKELRKQ